MTRIICISLLVILSFLYSGLANASRYYNIGYNFEVAADSLSTLTDDPLINIDSVCTYTLSRGQQFAVARIQYVPNDSATWVQLATVDMTDTIKAQLVWVREDAMLRSSIPDKIISKFIHGIRLRSEMIFKPALLLLLFLFMSRYLQRHPNGKPETVRQHTYIMLLDNIGSFYPLLLAICVATTTTAILLTPQSSWLHYYFHPSINPMAVSDGYVSASLICLWVTLVVAIATVTEAIRLTDSKKVWGYLCSIPCVSIFIVWVTDQVIGLLPSLSGLRFLAMA